MNSEKIDIAQLIEIARLYYEHNFSQEQIAKKMEISRPGISRLLQQAREMGIVRIKIVDPSHSGTRLEAKLKDKFGLKNVIVVPNDSSSTQIKKHLGEATVRFLDGLVNKNTVLGVSWGTTMQEVAKSFKRKSVDGMVVVQLNGGVSKAGYDTHASEVAQKIAEKCSATPYLLPLPAIVDNADLKQAIMNERNISRTLEYAINADVAIFTIGLFNQDSVLVKADYFEPDEINDLIKKGAIADICSRLITDKGEICSQELNQRSIGIELENLGTKKYSIAVAGGKEKLPAIRAGLKSGIFNVLITDEWVATQLLEKAHA